MSESPFKHDNPEWVKGYDRGRKDGREDAKRPWSRPRHYNGVIYREGSHGRKSADFCDGYDKGYHELMWHQSLGA